jgi:hypothetical protein
MNKNFSISKTAFVNLIDAYLPSDDDSGPWGPLGPVIRDRLLWILLNPQPLPPRQGPQPDPWRSRTLVRTIVDRTVSQLQLAEVMDAERLESTTEIASSQVLRFVDEFCGTWPPRWPWPPKFDPRELLPLDLLVAGAEFHKAAEMTTDHTLQKAF